MADKRYVTADGDDPWHAIKNAALGMVDSVQPRHDVGKHRYLITVELIEPKWWFWNSEEWEEVVDQDADWRGPSVQLNFAGRYTCYVYGTVEDRDGKRNALIDAARKAGKS